MKHLAASLALAVSLLPLAAPAQPNGCASADLSGAMQLLETHFANSPPRDLFVTQLLLREGTGHPEVTPDGKWGPITRGALCDMLQTYTAINGAVLVYGPGEVEDFTDWIASMAYFTLNGGEAPD